MNLFRQPGRVTRRALKATVRRSHRFTPTTSGSSLESRMLMAAGPIGVNLAGTLGFVDLMKETRPWTPLNGSTLASDANGWPLADAQVIVLDERVNQFFNGPDPNAVTPDIGGTYHLSFTGQASISADYPNNYTVQNLSYNTATNTTTADLIVTHNSLATLIIDFRNTVNPASSTGAGVSNVKLIQPGYTANTTQVFTTNMLSDVSPFSTVRYLNIDQANNYPPTTDSNGKLIPLDWSQRRLPSAASQTSGPGQPGEAWEYMIAFANATNTDMWINIPAPASDSYVAQLASLIKNGDTVNGVTYAGLNPNLKVNIEYSNEVWGGTYTPYAYNQAAAKQEVAAGGSTLNNDGSTDPYVWGERYYLERTMQITNIFRGVMGADPTYSTIRPELGWQEGNYNFYTTTFPWFEKNYGLPSNFFYGMGAANYINATDYSSVDNLIASLYASLPQEYATTQDFAAVANYYGLQTVAYEGGPSTGGATNDAQGQVALAASRDPRMEALIQQIYTTWYAAGGGLAEEYDGPYDNLTPNNQFAILEVAQAGNPTASAKYRGFLDLAQAAPVAITAGIPVSTQNPTALSITSDSLGQAFYSSPTSLVNYWTLNVPTAGAYVLSIQTGNNSANAQVAVSLGDSNKLGTYTIGWSSSTTLTTLALHAGLNTLSIAALNSFNVTGITLTPVPAASGAILNDTSFEAVQVPGTGYSAFAYDPIGSPWTFSGQAGLAANGSGFTANNPSAPSGNQVAFLQNQGSISQLVTVLSAGSYHLNFAAALRPYFQSQSFQILIDGAVIGTFTPSTSAYQAFSSASFALTVGSHTVMFKGLNPAGDATAFVDTVSLNQDSAASVNNVTISDPGFEAAKITGTGYNAYAYDPTGSPWTFNGTSGVSGNNSGFTGSNPAAPQGSQVAFLQNQGTITQTVSGFATGNYIISFLAAHRPFFQSQSFQVLVDGVVVGTFTPTTSNYQTMQTSSFTVTSGSHMVTFQGLNTTGDATAFIDSVSIAQDTGSTVTGATVGDAGFELPQIATSGYNAYTYDPTGTPWVFAGQSGVAANGSGFTGANPNAPEGTQVGFVQNQGSFSQTVSGFAAGNYHLTFSAAQRPYFQTQTFQVLVDGKVIGTFTPSGSNYQTLATGSFAVTAGSHTITFQGLNTTGDATAFIDAVTLTQETGGPTFSDAGFEVPLITGTGFNAYMYDPTGTPWVFAGQSGVAANGSGFTGANPNAPEGTQVGFVQNQGSFSQTVSGFAAGNYHLTFSAAQRPYFQTQTFQVLVDGKVIGTFTPSSSIYQTITTASFAVTAGTHTITFQGLNTVGDATSFIDAVALVAQ